MFPDDFNWAPFKLKFKNLPEQAKTNNCDNELNSIFWEIS